MAQQQRQQGVQEEQQGQQQGQEQLAVVPSWHLRNW
jgi:hypothetical protein